MRMCELRGIRIKYIRHNFINYSAKITANQRSSSNYIR